MLKAYSGVLDCYVLFVSDDVPAEEIPEFRTEMKTRGHMILPIIVLVVLLAL